MEESTVANSSFGFYEELVKTIAEPEPMCLILIRFELVSTKTKIALSPEMEQKLPEAVTASMSERLDRNLRDYDLLSRVEENVFVATLKTLVGREELVGRLENMKATLSEPYIFQEVEAVVNVEIGAAIRKPGEKPASLLQRADDNYQSL